MNFPGSFGISEGQASIKLVHSLCLVCKHYVVAYTAVIMRFRAGSDVNLARLPVSRLRECLDVADLFFCCLLSCLLSRQVDL